MGWFELVGWFERMEREKQGPEPDPESWRNAHAEPHWEEWKNNRERLRRRMN